LSDATGRPLHARQALLTTQRMRAAPNPEKQNMKLPVATFAIIAAATLAAGCTDLKPMQAQIDDLKTQVSRINSDTATLKASTDSTAAAARSASQSAAAAESAANQALAAAQASQACCDATNEKVDRMFKRSVSK
jgi:outer membrane murein-binding lipoprotein Lpp